jgi:protein-disulfide isomerase
MALALEETKGDEAYLRFSDAMMSMEGQANAASVLRVLAEQGHDPEAIAEASKQGAGKEALQKAQRLARHLNVRGTPSFVGPSGLSRGMLSLEDLAALSVNGEGS